MLAKSHLSPCPAGYSILLQLPLASSLSSIALIPGKEDWRPGAPRSRK